MCNIKLISPLSKVALLVVTSAIIFAYGCSGSGDGGQGTTPPATTSITGTWVGTYLSDLLEETPLLLELTQIDDNVSGNYKDLSGEYGTLSGSIDGKNFDFTTTSSNPNCPGTLAGIGNIVGSTLSFTFTGTNCLGTHNNGVGRVTFQVGDVLAFGQKSPSGIIKIGTELYWKCDGEEPIKKMSVSGGTPIALTRKIGVPVSMNIQGNDLYWIDFRPDKSKVLNRSSLDGTSTQILSFSNHYSDLYYTDEIIVDSENVFWATSTVSSKELSIQKVPLDGSPPSTIVAVIKKPIVAMVRDADYLYWIEGMFPEPGVIKRIPLAGGSICEIYTVGNGITGNLITEGSYLIVAEIVYPYPYNYRLLKVPTSGGTATILATLSQDPSPLKLSSDSLNVYWYDGTGIFSIPISGGSITQLTSVSTTYLDLIVDSTSLIWLESDSDVGTIYEIPLEGGVPSVLATDLFTPDLGARGVLAKSENKIYLAEGDPYYTWYGRIAEIPRLGGEALSFITGVTSALSSPWATDGTSIYIGDCWGAFGGGILKMPINGGHAETLARSGFDIVDLATDGTYVYWLEGGAYGVIKRVHITSGFIDTLTTIPGYVQGIEIDDNNIYWMEGLDYIRKIPIGGGSVTTLASDLAAVSAFIGDGNYIYYYEQDLGLISRVSVNGGPTKILASAIRWAIIDLAIDDSSLYWTDYMRICKFPKTGGNSELVISCLMQGDYPPISSFLVDATHVYWTESIGGTIKRAIK